jgi:phage terminase small subunit
MALNPQQELFAHEYVKDYNATRAYVAAGYSENGAGQSAHVLLKNPEISELVKKLHEEKLLELAGDKDYVLKTIVDTVERCRQIAPVVDRKGEQVLVETPAGELVPAFMFDSKGVMKGMELLAKYHKMLTDKIEATGKDGEPLNPAAPASVTIIDPIAAAKAYADLLKG